MVKAGGSDECSSAVEEALVSRLYLWHAGSGTLLDASEVVQVYLNQVEAAEIAEGKEVPPEKLCQPLVVDDAS